MKFKNNPARLFNLEPESLKDLPEAVKKSIDYPKSKKSAVIHSQIEDLMRVGGRPLTRNELIVGLFRGFGISMGRKELSKHIYNMRYLNKIFSVERGVYDLAKSTNNTTPSTAKKEGTTKKKGRITQDTTTAEAVLWALQAYRKDMSPVDIQNLLKEVGKDTTTKYIGAVIKRLTGSGVVKETSRGYYRAT